MSLTCATVRDGLRGHTYMTSAVGRGRGVPKRQTKEMRLCEFCT